MLPESSLNVLRTLFKSEYQKGLITRDNARKFGELVFVERIHQEAEPGYSHFVSLTDEGRKFCEEKLKPSEVSI